MPDRFRPPSLGSPTCASAPWRRASPCRSQSPSMARCTWGGGGGRETRPGSATVHDTFLTCHRCTRGAREPWANSATALRVQLLPFPDFFSFKSVASLFRHLDELAVHATPDHRPRFGASRRRRGWFHPRPSPRRHGLSLSLPLPLPPLPPPLSSPLRPATSLRAPASLHAPASLLPAVSLLPPASLLAAASLAAPLDTPAHRRPSPHRGPSPSQRAAPSTLGERARTAG